VKRIVISIAAAAFAAIFARPVLAQSRPLVTEDPETVPVGKILIEAGADYARDASYPASGLRGNLWRLGTFGSSFGVGPITEIQMDGGVRNQLSIKSFNPAAPLAGMLNANAVPGNSTGDVEDLVFGTKVRFASETPSRPSFAVRLATRLPNAGNESGLGLDTTDFTFALLVGKTAQSVRVVGNVGLGILGDPVRGDNQNDVVLFGMSMARAVRNGFEVVGELNGRINTRNGTPPVGTDSRAGLRLGSRYTTGPVRIDGAIFVGITENDPSWGFTFGGTWVFKAFDVK
jgi:hypothetical protein